MPYIRTLKKTLPIAAMTPDERRAYDAQRKADSRARANVAPLPDEPYAAYLARSREAKKRRWAAERAARAKALEEKLRRENEKVLSWFAPCEDATLTPSSNPHTSKPLKGNDL